eukprot:3392057-Prymnesium_polylepis.1
MARVLRPACPRAMPAPNQAYPETAASPRQHGASCLAGVPAMDCVTPAPSQAYAEIAASHQRTWRVLHRRACHQAARLRAHCRLKLQRTASNMAHAYDRSSPAWN